MTYLGSAIDRFAVSRNPAKRLKPSRLHGLVAIAPGGRPAVEVAGATPPTLHEARISIRA